MKSPQTLRINSWSGVKPAAVKVLAVSMMALTLAGCKSVEDPGQVQSWTLVDPAQRHPIMVKETPTRIKVSVPRGSSGLSPRQRANVASFLARFRTIAMGNSKLSIAAPSGSPNEVAAMRAVADIRHLVAEYGIADDIVSVDAYHDESDPAPPVRVSFRRYVATAPECGDWSEDLGNDPRNLHYPNFGCAYQRNVAAMIANPADLLGPRTETPRDSERRDVNFDKYYKGQPTGAEKSKDERARVKQ